MWRPFHGTISGNGLELAEVEGEFDERAGSPPAPRYGQFLWHGNYVFLARKVYSLDVAGSRSREIFVAAVHVVPSGAGVEVRRVEFGSL